MLSCIHKSTGWSAIITCLTAGHFHMSVSILKKAISWQHYWTRLANATTCYVSILQRFLLLFLEMSLKSLTSQLLQLLSIFFHKMLLFSRSFCWVIAALKYSWSFRYTFSDSLNSYGNMLKLSVAMKHSKGAAVCVSSQVYGHGHVQTGRSWACARVLQEFLCKLCILCCCWSGVSNRFVSV